jgi:hypothetical protein
MSKEIVRVACLAVGCALLFILLGFSPLWFSSVSDWSATRDSAVALPVGASGVSDVKGPLGLSKQPSVTGDPAPRP